ncbi:MAG: hypothetical protein ABJA67_09790 [Chthonomonadales bacterium]
MRTGHIIALANFAVACLTTVYPSLAQTGPKPPAQKIDERVRSMMDDMIAGYKAQTTLQEKVSFKFTSNVPEMTPEVIPIEFVLKIQKPNKLALAWSEKGKSGVVRKQIISDGATETDFNEDTNTYFQSKAPLGLPAAPAVLNVPEFELLFNGRDPFINLHIPSQLLKVGDPVKIGEFDCDVLIGTVTQPALNLTASLRLSIAKKDHLIRSMVFEGNGGTADKPIKFKYEALYTVTLLPVLTESDFSFTPPPGAKLQTNGKKP